MVKINRILCDVDGVHADFVYGMCKAHNRPNPFLGKENAGKFNINEIWEMSATEFWAPTTNKEWWANLPLMDGAKELVKFCEDKVGQENVCFLTSPTSGEGCIDGKIAWIKKHFPKYKRRFLIGPVKYFCANPHSLLIDDYDKNFNEFRHYRGNAYLPPRPWNSRHSEYSDEVRIIKDREFLKYFE